jgi:hypothetical protein
VVGIKRKMDSPAPLPSTPTGKELDNKSKAPQTPQSRAMTMVTPTKHKLASKLDKENPADILSPSKIPIAIKSPVLSPISVNKPSCHAFDSIPIKKRKVFTPDSKIPLKSDALKASEFITPTKQSTLPLQTPKKSLLKRILATATPGQVHSPRNLTTADSTKNLTMTAYSDPQQCIQKLIEGLKPKGIDCKQKGYTIRCAMNNKFSNVLTFNLEICQFHDKIAIQRKRLRGDAWNYKKICEEILRISNDATIPEVIAN